MNNISEIINSPFTQSLIDFLPYPLVLAQPKDGSIKTVYLNKKFIEEIGYTKDEITYQEEWFSKAYPDPEYRKELFAAWDSDIKEMIVNKRHNLKRIARITTKHKGEQWYEISGTMLDGINVIAFINIQDKIVKQKELEQTNLNKDKMLSILGHDIHGPLANLHMLSELMMSEDMSREEFVAIVKEVNAKTQRVKELVQTTVQWTRANFDDIVSKRERVLVKKEVEEVIQLFENRLSEKQINITATINDNEVLETDVMILKTIIRNLLANAIKFTPEKGNISILVKNNELEVCDSGVGMSQEAIKNIYKKRNVSTTGTDAEEGLGIGLKLTLDLIDKINAKIDIKSEINQGTNMKVSF